MKTALPLIALALVLAAVIDKMSACATKKMIYTPGDGSADADGCVSVGGASLPSDYCYAQIAERWQTPSCDEGYYVKGGTKATDNNWDGYGAVCCYSKPGKDPRVESDRAGFISRSATASSGGTHGLVASTVGQSYAQIVAACKANAGLFGGHSISCPAANVLSK